MTGKNEKSNLYASLMLPILFVAIMWLVYVLELLLETKFSEFGLFPRYWLGLRGIITAPFLHGDFNHIVSNTLPMLILGFALINGYPKVAGKAFLIIYFLVGFWVWAAARPNYHIGASGIIYGLVAFLFFIGLLRKDKQSIALSLLVTFLYGSFIWGIFPVEAGISWESHLLGGIAGIFTAYLFYKIDLPPKPIQDFTEEEISHLPYWKYEVEGDLKKEEPLEEKDISINYIYRPDKKKDNPN